MSILSDSWRRQQGHPQAPTYATKLKGDRPIPAAIRYVRHREQAPALIQLAEGPTVPSEYPHLERHFRGEGRNGDKGVVGVNDPVPVSHLVLYEVAEHARAPRPVIFLRADKLPIHLSRHERHGDDLGVGMPERCP